MSLESDLLERYDLRPATIDRSDGRISFVHGGRAPADAPSIVLLHGFPQSWIMWRHVLPRLAPAFRIVAIDLRGYGASLKPADPDAYGQRISGDDVVAVLDALGIERAIFLAHDRGARVTRRLALDRPERLLACVLLDILPLEYVYDRLSAAEAAERFWHWTFQVVPDLAERLVPGNEAAYLLRLFSRAPGMIERLQSDGAWDAYLRVWREDDGLRGALGDYRRAFTVDLPRYREERTAGRRFSTPTLVLWGSRGNLASRPVESIWNEVAEDLTGAEIADCGHYLPEERPEAVCDHTFAWLRDRGLVSPG